MWTNSSIQKRDFTDGKLQEENTELNNGISQKQWVCYNTKYCNGRVTNHKDRKECRNCGMRVDDKRRKIPITCKYVLPQIIPRNTYHSKCSGGTK